MYLEVKTKTFYCKSNSKNPEVYIFDDSFSALDLKTDAALRKALKSKLLKVQF